jgi:hypothetical protein
VLKGCGRKILQTPSFRTGLAAKYSFERFHGGDM